jgi:hypothetical protein
MFSAVPRASGPVFMFCAPGLVFSGTEGVVSRFHVLCSQTHFRRYRGRQVPFSCLCSRNRLRRYLGRRVPISCFVLPDMFSAVPSASGSDLIFCAPRTRFRRCRVCLVLYSCFVLPDSFSAVPRASGSVFMFCAPRLIFGGTEGVVSRFHVLCSQTHFRRYRGRRVPFSCFARPDLFPTVPRASDAVLMFSVPELIFGGTEDVGSRFHVLRARTRFRR